MHTFLKFPQLITMHLIAFFRVARTLRKALNHEDSDRRSCLERITVANTGSHCETRYATHSQTAYEEELGDRSGSVCLFPP